MINEISQHLNQIITEFPEEDSIIFNNTNYKINKDNFHKLSEQTHPITFIDGGQAEIISSANFCLSFIRVAAVKFPNKETIKKEFFLLTTAKYINNDIYYYSKIFGDKLIDENDLLISSNDKTIKTGNERAPITKITNMARRFAELSLAKEAEFALLDGTLEKKFLNEDKYLMNLPEKTAALAKSSSLFTTSGNSPIVLLNKLSPEGCWCYKLNENTSFVKLNDKAGHVFRFEGDKELQNCLINNSSDALFLGYPYGLILADKLARVSNEEKNSLRMKFLLNSKNKEIVSYLRTSNAHEILDNLG